MVPDNIHLLSKLVIPETVLRNSIERIHPLLQLSNGNFKALEPFLGLISGPSAGWSGGNILQRLPQLTILIDGTTAALQAL